MHTISEPTTQSQPFGTEKEQPAIVKTDYQKAASNKKPDVKLPGDNRPGSAFASELGPIMAPHGIFERQGSAVRIVNGAIEPVKPVWFSTYVENYVTTFAEKSDRTVVRTMSAKDAKATLESDHFKRHLHRLARINPVCMPAITKDGSIKLLQPGYDQATATFTQHGIDYTDSMDPTEAAKFLKTCLKDFPFADDGRSLAVVVAAMLSTYGIGLLPTKTVVPAFMIDGNRPGLGKGLLAQYAIIPVLGYSPTGVRPKSEDEIRKQLLAAAKGGQRIVVFDNLIGHLHSPSLEAYLTSSVFNGRILGTSNAPSFQKEAVVFVTGNGCTLSQDMERRTLIARLHSDVPSTDRKLASYIDENTILTQRPEILAALWALIRDWDAKGRPEPSQIHPSFAVWSKIIGGIVENAGFKCPCTPITTVEQPNDDTVDMGALTAAMHENRQEGAFTFKDIVTIARAKELFAARISSRGEGCTKSEKTSLGRFLSLRHGIRHENGLIFMVTGLGHARRFSVRQAKPVTEGGLKAA